MLTYIISITHERVSKQILKTTRYSEIALSVKLIVSVLHILNETLNDTRLNRTWIIVLFCYAQTALNIAYQQYLSSQHIVRNVTTLELFKVIKRNPKLLLPFGHSPPTHTPSNSPTYAKRVRTTKVGQLNNQTIYYKAIYQ